MRVKYIISEKWESKDIHEIIDAVDFAIKFFDMKDAKSTLTVKLINGAEEPVEATADKIKNKRYEVRIARAKIEQTLDAVLVALFHELTHIKQFVKDGFDLNKGKWKGKDLKDLPIPEELVNNKEITKGDLYWFSPWEMEARAMERSLVVLYDRSR